MADLLDRMLTMNALWTAWAAVEDNAGQPGGDGVSLTRFARRLDAQLLTLTDDVRAGRYAPGAARRVHVQFGAKRRTLDILPVRDRVLQRAALDVLTAPIDATFLPGSYGYRPGRSLHDAVRRIVRLRGRGLLWVLDADIADCFPNLERDRLMDFVRALIPDQDLIDLIAIWIDVNIDVNSGAPEAAGISLGAPISPLFCNIYLHHLDSSLARRRLHVVRYADDFVVLCGSQARAEWALRATEKVVRGLGLSLNAKKTRLVTFDDGFDFLGVHFERNHFTYVSDGKRITVDGEVPPFLHELPDGYQ